MISTIESKEQQLANGFFQSGSGPTQILILGSCRTLAYLSYLIRWNDTDGKNEFTIRRIDPCDWAVSGVEMDSLETDGRILPILKSTDIFIHEYIVSYGMFNTEATAARSIYQFGVEAQIDITIPNFHDRFCLEHDWTACGIPTPDNYIEQGERHMEGFCAVAEKSSFPVFAKVFRDTWRDIRYFWRPNHVSANFTVGIFVMMNRDFLELPLTEEFWEEARKEDLFKEPHTEVTQRDIEGYHLTWR